MRLIASTPLFGAPHQPRAFSMAPAQEVLPHLRLRAAGRRHQTTPSACCRSARSTSFPLEAIFHFLHEEAVDEALMQAALQSPMWETHAGGGTSPARWRCCVTRAAGAPRRRSLRDEGCRPAGRRCSRPRPAARTIPRRRDDRAARPPAGPQDHPRLPARGHGRPTASRPCCGGLHGGEIRALARDTVAPSPFSARDPGRQPVRLPLDDAIASEERWARQVKTARPGELSPSRRRPARPRPARDRVDHPRHRHRRPRRPARRRRAARPAVRPRLLPHAPRVGRAIRRPGPRRPGLPPAAPQQMSRRTCPLRHCTHGRPRSSRWRARYGRPRAIEPSIALPPALAGPVDPEEAALRLVRAFSADRGHR